MLRPFLHAAGMFVLGLLGLLVVDRLHRMQAMSPVPAHNERFSAIATSGMVREQPSGDRRLAAVLDGLLTDLRTAAARLTAGERREGVAALDGAFRVVQVLQANLDSVSLVAQKIRQARTSLQDGNPARAGSLASEAAALVRGLSSRGRKAPVAPVDYVHATLVDPHGTVKGTITDATADHLRVAPGELPVLGFIGPRSADAYSVRPSALLFGEVRHVGPTMVIDTGAR